MRKCGANGARTAESARFGVCGQELADSAVRAPGLWRTRAIGLIFVTAVVLSLRGEIIGTNVPALPLTLSRIRQLPASDQSEWAKYLERSQRQLLEEQNALRRELKAHGLTQTTPAPAGKTSRGLLQNHEADWYGGEEARRIADIIVSYQTPAGGWSDSACSMATASSGTMPM